MKIKYLGHAAFELDLDDGKKVVFDPYESGSYGGALAYGPIQGEFDLAIISHDHADHRCEGVVTRAKNIVDSAGEHDLEGFKVKAFPTYHDESDGSERGSNLISIIEAEGIRIAHLGDLGHRVSAEEIPDLKGVDVLLIPVGGHFTIDAKVAADLVAAFKPRIAIPMHFKTDKVDFPIRPVEEFASLMENVEKAGGSEITVTKEGLPEPGKVVVLYPAL
jgi:L-ascorbate metabolism protein UlaG (beta-lactamase superfamily)